MSRARIAAAINTVPGLLGNPLPPLTPTPGMGWPQWVRTEYRTHVGACQSTGTEWDVWVCLPPLDAPDTADTLRDQVANALVAAGVLVEACQPDAIEIDNMPVAVLRFTAQTKS